jgi:hypothetical protein
MWRLIFVIILVLLFVAFRYLPWWVLLGIVVVFVLLWRFVLGSLLGALLILPLKNMGKMLRGATADVHSVRPTERPATVSSPPEVGKLETTNHEGSEHHEGSEVQDAAEDADEAAADEYDGPRNWFEVDVTITPLPSSKGGIPYWDMNALRLTKPGSSMKDDDDSCCVQSVHLVREGAVLLNPGQTDPTDEEENHGKLTGPHRLKMVIGVKPEVRELVFGYFFETFGKLVVPEAQTSGT